MLVSNVFKSISSIDPLNASKACNEFSIFKGLFVRLHECEEEQTVLRNSEFMSVKVMLFTLLCGGTKSMAIN